MNRILAAKAIPARLLRIVPALVTALVIPLAAPPAPAQQDRLAEQVRHELAMLPYISVFDYLGFRVEGSRVTLTGYTVRPTNRSTAENVVKRIEGIEEVDNQIEVLPPSGSDRRIRAGVRAKLQRMLPRYFAGPTASIRIIVKNGNVTLFGVVDSERDKQIAGIQTNSVSGVFGVENELTVQPPAKNNKT